MRRMLEVWRDQAGPGNEVNGYEWLTAGCPTLEPHMLLVFDGDVTLTQEQWLTISNGEARVIVTGTLNVDGGMNL